MGDCLICEAHGKAGSSGCDFGAGPAASSAMVLGFGGIAALLARKLRGST